MFYFEIPLALFLKFTSRHSNAQGMWKKRVLRKRKQKLYLHKHRPSLNDGTSIWEMRQSKSLFLHHKYDPVSFWVCQVNQRTASSKNASRSWKENVQLKRKIWFGFDAKLSITSTLNSSFLSKKWKKLLDSLIIRRERPLGIFARFPPHIQLYLSIPLG